MNWGATCESLWYVDMTLPDTPKLTRLSVHDASRIRRLGRGCNARVAQNVADVHVIANSHDLSALCLPLPLEYPQATDSSNQSKSRDVNNWNQGRCRTTSRDEPPSQKPLPRSSARFPRRFSPAASFFRSYMAGEITGAERRAMAGVAESFRQRINAPGLSIAIARAGRFEYAEAFGTTGHDSAEPLSPPRSFASRA